MKETKHTPGPWYPVEFAGFHVIKTEPYYDAGDDLLDVEESPNAEANAKLIAAAPELLECLKEIIAISDRDHSAWEYAKSIIKKATE